MNYKNLNYEIETCYVLMRSVMTTMSMNYKNLNYEIETNASAGGSGARLSAMNYKNLNYEIETLTPVAVRAMDDDYEL